MAERFKAPVLKTGEGSNLPWVRIPLSPPDTQDAPKGAFCVSGGESGLAEAARVRRIRLERIRTADWLALGRLRTRVRCMDAPHNPTREIRRSDAPKGAFYVSGGGSGLAEATRVRRIRLERIRTAEWLALGRLRTRVRCMDAPHNPTREIRRSDAPKGAFCVSGGESEVAEAAWVGQIRLERIRIAEWPALKRSSEGLGAWIHSTLPLRKSKVPDAPKGAFFIRCNHP